MRRDLHGQRVVSWAGTSSIGLATAKAAARFGAEVTVISRQASIVDPSAGLISTRRPRALRADLTVLPVLPLFS